MRIAALLLLLGLVLPACQGAEPLPATDGYPPQLDGLPRPSELPRANTHPQAGSTARSVSYIYRIQGDLLRVDLPHANAEPSQDLPLCTMEAQPGELSYCFLGTLPSALGPTSILHAVYADAQWSDEPPASPQGVYLGLPDYDADAWAWVGPVELGGPWVDVSALEIEGSENEDCFAIVNYSEQDLTFYALCFYMESSVVYPEESWIYYAGYDAAEPDSRTSIWRIQPRFSTTPEKVLPGTEDRAYTDPRIAYFGEDVYLAYARQEGSDPSGIWRATLDGIATQALWTAETINYKPGCWNKAGTRCTYLQLAPTGRYNLYAKPIGVPLHGLLARDVDNIADAWWDPSTSSDYSVVFSLRLEMPVHTVIARIHTFGDPPLEIEPSILLEQDMTNFIHPCPFEVLDGQGHSTDCITFSMAVEGATMDAYWIDLAAPSLIRPLFLDPERDILGPAASPLEHMLAFVSIEPGEDSGELYITDFTTCTGDYADATLLADGVVPQMTWYRPSS